jgi:hypothetical protein
MSQSIFCCVFDFRLDNLPTSIVAGRHSQTLHDCFVVVFASSVAVAAAAGIYRPAFWTGFEPSFNEYLVMFFSFLPTGLVLAGKPR